MTDNGQLKTAESTDEKRLKRIAQLKAKIQKEEALFNHSLRKKRNGQLVVLGVLVEELYKSSDEAGRNQWREKAKERLKERNLDRALAAFSRLDGEG